MVLSSKKIKVLVSCEHEKNVWKDWENLKYGKSHGCNTCHRPRKDKKHYKNQARWYAMMKRCSNTKDANYKNYGGRGIYVSEEFKTFEFYHEYIKSLDGYNTPYLSLDRIDNDKGYERGNLRWTTQRTQTINKRGTTFVDFNNERICFNEFATNYTKLSLSYARRRFKEGYTLEELVSWSPDYKRLRNK